MIFGGFWFVGGFVVTVVTEGAIIAWGAILFGFIDILIGVFGLIKAEAKHPSYKANRQTRESEYLASICKKCDIIVAWGEDICPECGSRGARLVAN